MENFDLELSFSNDFSNWCPSDVIGWTARSMVEDGFGLNLAELKQSLDHRNGPQHKTPSSWLVSDDDDESRCSAGLDALPETSSYLKANVYEFATYASSRDGTVTHDEVQDRTDYAAESSDQGGTTSAPLSSCSSPSAVRSSTTGGSTSRRRRKRIINAQQRLAANVRERKRMTCMNAAFDSLRQRMPASDFDRRRSRIEILKSAVSYIQFLTGVLDTV